MVPVSRNLEFNSKASHLSWRNVETAALGVSRYYCENWILAPFSFFSRRWKLALLRWMRLFVPTCRSSWDSQTIIPRLDLKASKLPKIGDDVGVVYYHHERPLGMGFRHKMATRRCIGRSLREVSALGCQYELGNREVLGVLGT